MPKNDKILLGSIVTKGREFLSVKETSLPSETREVPGVSSKATKTLFLGPREAFKFYDCNLDSSAVQCHCCVLHQQH